jgi:hypothetical protein
VPVTLAKVVRKAMPLALSAIGTVEASPASPSDRRSRSRRPKRRWQWRSS